MAIFRGPSYSCRNCHNPVALPADILSKKFLAKTGKAYMFAQAMNIVVGKSEDKQLMTGVYTVADISCNNCGEVLGWKYLRAYEARDKYKEGNFILELSKIAKEY